MRSGLPIGGMSEGFDEAEREFNIDGNLFETFCLSKRLPLRFAVNGARESCGRRNASGDSRSGD